MNLAKMGYILQSDKKQCVIFEGQAPKQFNPVIDGNSLMWISKIT